MQAMGDGANALRVPRAGGEPQLIQLSDAIRFETGNQALQQARTHAFELSQIVEHGCVQCQRILRKSRHAPTPCVDDSDVIAFAVCMPCTSAKPVRPSVTAWATRARRLRAQIGLWLLIVVLVPILGLAWIYLHREVAQIKADQAAHMHTAAVTAAAALEQFLVMHRAAIEYLALDLGRDADRHDELPELASLRVGFPGFLTLLRTDAAARVIAVSTPGGIERDRQLLASPHDVADRSYFRVPRYTGQSYVSDAFRGRRLGDDLIVAVAAPILPKPGDFRGVVQGALRLAAFDQITRRLALASTDMSLDVIDRAGQVVYSTGARKLPLLSPSDYNLDQARELRAESLVDGLGWTVRIRAPSAQVERARLQLYAEFGAALAIGLALVMIALIRVAALIAAPLETIKRDLDQLDLDRPQPASSLQRLPPGAALEVSAIRSAFVDLINRLIDARAAWNGALAERDHSNHSLAQVVAERDAHIASQTEALQQALADARAANAAKDQLLANTSHEIRTPLNGIIGSAELLLREPMESAQRARLQTLLRSAESLLSLLNDLLDLARIRHRQDEISRQPFALKAEVELLIAALSALAQQQGLDFRVDYHGPLPEWVTGDLPHLRQVLLNLAGNAIKFTERGSVRIQLSAGAGDQVQFSVRDTGIGLSQHDQARVFEPFFQVDAGASRRFKGTGLGLAIARDLVAAMGGELSLHSELGSGSEFFFRIPLPAAVAPQVAAPTQPAPAAAVAGQRVLVVDDVETNREVAQAQLEALGQTVTSVASGAAALTAVTEAEFDVILLDCQMPDMDGYETARRMRALPLQRQPRIVALTAHAQASERARCLEAGMDDYLSKPLRLSALRGVLSVEHA